MGKPPPTAWEIVLLPSCLQDLTHWVENDRQLALKTLTLIEQTSRNPFSGLGKPELLKHLHTTLHVSGDKLLELV